MTRASEVIAAIGLMLIGWAIMDTWWQAHETNRFIEQILEITKDRSK